MEKFKINNLVVEYLSMMILSFAGDRKIKSFKATKRDFSIN